MRQRSRWRGCPGLPWGRFSPAHAPGRGEARRHKRECRCAKDHHFSALYINRYSGPIHIIPFFRLLLKKAVCGLNYESLILFYSSSSNQDQTNATCAGRKTKRAMRAACGLGHRSFRCAQPSPTYPPPRGQARLLNWVTGR